MSYIGASPTTVAFLTDQFSGNGSTTAFTMSVAPATTTSVLVSVTGVLQDPTTYSVVGTTLTFSAAPPTGTGNISVRYMGIPASGVTTTAYRTVTEFTATSGQTTFTPPSYTVGFINVFRNGVRLGSADFTASNGTTVVLTNAATVGDLVVTESFYVSSVLNAIPATAGAVNSTYISSVNSSAVLGTTTNDNAAAGIVGEYIASTVSATTSGLTSNTPANAASITLSAGDWDVSGGFFLNFGGGTSGTYAVGAFNTTSATLPNLLAGAASYIQTSLTASSGYGAAIPTTRFSVSSPTVVYMVTNLIFSGGTAGNGGTIRARRVR